MGNEPKKLSDALRQAALVSTLSNAAKKREADEKQARINATPIAPHLAAVR